MRITSIGDIQPVPVDADGALHAVKRLLIGSGDGAPLFSMRLFDIAPGGCSPSHRHSFEHEIFVVEGSGTVISKDEEHPIQPGTSVYIAPDETHQLKNNGAGTLRFLCIVPREYE
ncbi:MAG TPA: cupin domain-containing protein [Spirochaetota bacterium]|nr:cupin domain-containing protein [Spirochaetota bacterium]HPJ39237.1 cupin domain-containing protein [Spirochaetota bacterium]HPQ53715.1 cupin domain-containing protein [Spirochaetota bacterium]